MANTKNNKILRLQQTARFASLYYKLLFKKINIKKSVKAEKERR